MPQRLRWLLRRLAVASPRNLESWQSLQRNIIPAATTRRLKRILPSRTLSRGLGDVYKRQLTDIDALGGLPEGSLGNDLYRMLVDNNFDAEVLDREVIGLANLPPALRYDNTRILQMHDVWHLVAGYQTTSLHEIAISAFQLAQCGLNYSSLFLASVATMRCGKTPAGCGLLMQNITEAWRHGRTTPALMPIHWESEWHETPEQIRARHGITPFKGSFPPDLLEQLAAVA